ncbi:MAG TPA: protein phosphatase 2C domain-containing protein [Kofleriaceae bacterium]
MYTMSAITAAVTGARHLRMVRNGQDAAAGWTGDGVGAVVVCDGCGAGASSEVGARLGARLVIAALRRQLGAPNGSPDWPRVWGEVRAQVTAALGALLAAMAPDDREAAVHDHLLFTVVAAAVARGSASVWAIGDGGYAFGDQHRVLGPFADNQPPYLGYDLLGAPAEPHLEVFDVSGAGRLVVASDGAAELELAALELDRVRNPDALRRRLAVLARAGERIDWDARRVVRTPAALQDDGAIAVLRWAARS